MKKLLLLLLLTSNACLADEAFVSYGVGIFHDADHYTGQNKYGELGLRQNIWNGIYWQNKAGYWGEGSPDTTRKNGFWGSSGLGLELNLQPIEMRSGWGLAIISSPDSQLGGRFPQFNGELYLGLRDKAGNGVGFQYEHISSAGIVTPNQGRDFVTIQLSRKW